MKSGRRVNRSYRFSVVQKMQYYYRIMKLYLLRPLLTMQKNDAILHESLILTVS